MPDRVRPNEFGRLLKVGSYCLFEGGTPVERYRLGLMSFVQGFILPWAGADDYLVPSVMIIFFLSGFNLNFLLLRSFDWCP